jgi:hypothetical protein
MSGRKEEGAAEPCLKSAERPVTNGRNLGERGNGSGKTTM